MVIVSSSIRLIIIVIVSLIIRLISTDNGPDYRSVDHKSKGFIISDFSSTAGSKNILRYNYTGDSTRRRIINYPRGSKTVSD
jgi:hypothetical protein